MKYYLTVEGIEVDVENEEKAEQACYYLEHALRAMGMKAADVLFSTEEDYAKDHNY